MNGMTKKLRRLTCGASLIAFASVAVSSTKAQQATAAATASPSADADQASGQIIVTANKFGAQFSKSAVAVTSISPQQLAATHAITVQDVAFQTPSIIINNPGNYASAYIRGVGATYALAGQETPVATYVDGAYLQRASGASLDLVDVASVDVLRGPQGTLYGRNATGGAILIETAKPTDHFEGYFSGEYGNFDQSRIQAMLNVPIANNFAVRIAGQYRNLGGYLDNEALGHKVGGGHSSYIRGKARWNVTPDFTAEYTLEYSNTVSHAFSEKNLLDAPYCTTCALFPGVAKPAPAGDFYSATTNPVFNNGRFTAQNLTLTYKAEDYTINSVTSYRDSKTSGRNDEDSTSVDFLYGRLGESGPTFTNDTYVRTSFQSALNGLFGASFLHDRDHQINPQGGIALGGLEGLNSNRWNISSYSIYGEATIDFGGGFKATGGARYNHDSKKVSVTNDAVAIAAFGLAPDAAAFRLKAAFHAITPRAVLSYTNGGSYVYASYNRGEKSGAFSSPTFSPGTVPATAERLDSFEIGAKNEFFNGRLRTSIDGFYGKYKNIQVIIEDVTHGAALFENAASAKIRGIEFSADAKLLPGFDLTGGVTYLHNRFGSFANAAEYAPSAAPDGTCSLAVTGIGLTGCTVDLSKTRMPRSPTWSGYVGTSYTQAMPGDWKLRLNGNAHFTSGFDFVAGRGGPLGLDRQKGYTKVDAAATVLTPDSKTEIGLYVTNLFGVHYNDYLATGSVGAYGVASIPRTFGGRIKRSF